MKLQNNINLFILLLSKQVDIAHLESSGVCSDHFFIAAPEQTCLLAANDVARDVVVHPVVPNEVGGNDGENREDDENIHFASFLFYIIVE